LAALAASARVSAARSLASASMSSVTSITSETISARPEPGARIGDAVTRPP
jgi:hypothetical protein